MQIKPGGSYVGKCLTFRITAHYHTRFSERYQLGNSIINEIDIPKLEK